MSQAFYVGDYMPSPLLRHLPGPGEPPNRDIEPRDLALRHEIYDRWSFDYGDPDPFKYCSQVETVCLTLHHSVLGIRHVTRLPCRRVTRCGACAYARWIEKTSANLMDRTQGMPDDLKETYDKGTWERVVWVGTNLDQRTYNAVKSKASRLKAGTLTLTMHNGKRHVVASCDLSPRRPNPEAEQWILYEPQVEAEDRVDSPTFRYSAEAQAQIDRGISRYELVKDALLKAVTDDYPTEAYAGCNRITWSRHWAVEEEGVVGGGDEEGDELDEEADELDEDGKPPAVSTFVAFGPAARQFARHERAKVEMPVDIERVPLWEDELRIYQAYMLGMGEKKVEEEEESEENGVEAAEEEVEESQSEPAQYSPRNSLVDKVSKDLKTPGSSVESDVDSPGSPQNSSGDLDSVQSFEEGVRLLKEKFGIVDGV